MTAQTYTIQGPDCTVAVESEGKSFCVNGDWFEFESEISRRILASVIDKFPKPVPLKELANLGSQQVAKYVSKLHRDLRNAKVPTQVLKSVRAAGYRLHSTWKKKDQGRPGITEALGELRKILQRSQEHVQASNLCTDEGLHLTFVERSSSTAYIATDHSVRARDAGWQLIHELRWLALPAAAASQIITLKDTIERLRRFTEFTRLGHRYSHEDWRVDFCNESNALMSSIESQVEQLLKLAGSAAKSSGLPAA